MKKLLTKGTLNKILSLSCILLIFLFFVPRTFATSDFTTSNLTFDPTSGRVDFDYTGVDLTGGNPSISMFNTAGTNRYWTDIGGNMNSCTSSHCTLVLFPSAYSDSGVSTVILKSASGKISQNLNYPLPLPTTNTPQNTIAGGWTNVGETWTYASADSPTYTFTIPDDETGRYSPGMRIKLTQSSTTKYFIITGVSYSNPNTTVTVYGGTDYTLANSSITSTYFSMQKAPQGFPLDPTKWTVQTNNTSDNSQASPTQGTWYNLGSVSIAIPIGAWQVSYQVAVQLTNSSAGTFASKTTLSTANNSESDIDFSTYQGTYVNLNNGYTAMREKNLTLTSKTTYYLNTRSESANLGTIYNLGLESPIIINAVSTYL